VKRVLILSGLVFFIITLLFTGCGRPKIRVGTGMAPERLLLAQMIIVLLNENGFDVIDMTPTGSTKVTHKALEDGIIDIYPEYTGNYLEADTSDPNSQIVWLKQAPADNKWAIAITQRLYEAAKIETMSDFATYVNDPDRDNIKLICSSEFTTNPLALLRFQDIYKFTLDPEQLIILPSTGTLYMGQEAADPKNDINAAMAYTTDGHLDRLKLIILKDDKSSQQIFHPAPLVRRDLYQKYSDELNRVLTPLFDSLNQSTLKELNSQIGLVGKEVTSVIARKYIQEHCFFKYGELQMVQNAMDKMMQANGKKTVTTQDKPTSDMSAFPDTKYALYSESPRWIQGELVEPYITWRTTKGTYTCDSNGLVTQHTTGW
jgi:osmoprotectant transport system substrate-binding protein